MQKIKTPKEMHQVWTPERAARRRKEFTIQTLIYIMTTIVLLCAFISIFLMIFLSLKSKAQFYGRFWAWPNPPQWGNYAAAWGDLWRNMINSILTVLIGVMGTVCLSAMSGYVFAKLHFPGKNFLFLMLLALMMIPGVLTLTPSYKLMQRIHLTNTWFALWFPWISGSQIMGIYMCRTFMGSQPSALFESARIDGATEFQAFYKIAVPLAKPILATLVVMNMIGFYGDFIWPLMVIETTAKQVISVQIRTYTSDAGTDYGKMIAGFVVCTIPLLVMFCTSARLYIEGLTSGAIKA